ncbi:aldehyde dehydrogenase [Marmoricola endophyticus]|uniref:Aldehyde dehydrogenase n=1 Tax=Marmoricola endophyticus TaxID=2040280 RepID=A0A917BET0_9ACTN|nr:aldehyde dehydrogenase family protein [Marmoricola endophyticus]GGF38654.1 aldehyde dehydrogenase [Marmoricola endophyticus]
MTENRMPNLIAGERVHGDDVLDVTHPYDGSPAGSTTYATSDQVERAVAHAAAIAPEAARLPMHVRADALRAVSEAIKAHTDELAALITAENGKPMQWSRGEVGRAVSVFRWAAEETRQESGEAIRLDSDPGGEGRLAYVRRVPRGPVLAISPFNFPLNLVAHKLAPAVAVGAPVVLKPAPKTPLSGIRLGELIAEAGAEHGLPAGMVQVVNVKNEDAGSLTEDERLPVLSFTGSGPVGYSIRDQVPGKHVTLELGGNAGVLVAADADLDHAAKRIAMFSNYQAGQSCIGVQRVFAEQAAYDVFKDKLVAQVEALVTGDPKDEDVFVGPLIDDAAADKVEQWVDAAVEAGATVLTGGVREGTTYAPTVLEGVPHDVQAWCAEIFGPVLVVEPVPDVETGFAAINDSDFGLQAGVFTTDIATAFRAHRELEVGGVVIGDAPSYRADQMPYGGVKDSGVGREGIRYAMADFTYERVMVLTGLDL